MADQNIESAKCSRCESALDTTGYPLWCKACRAKNQREYQSLRKQMAETRGFAAGVAAMRATVAYYFQHQLGSAGLSGAEAAHLVRKVEGPRLPATD